MLSPHNPARLPVKGSQEKEFVRFQCLRPRTSNSQEVVELCEYSRVRSQDWDSWKQLGLQ